MVLEPDRSGTTRTENRPKLFGMVPGRCYLGVELLKSAGEGSESILKSIWHHSDALVWCSMKFDAGVTGFRIANQAGLDMLETTLVALQQGFACLQGGICVSSMGRPFSYDRAVAWKVLNDEENARCICFMFINW
ncbi:homeobox-leucine zipper protein ATHB-15 [Tanacetum coccineum]